MSDTKRSAVIGLSLEEKKEIVKAMGSLNWFKCGNGHIYCVGECGKPKFGFWCPKCGTILLEMNL
jgi:hypothetical protein